MSVILVTGGTGALGRLVVERLRTASHEVRVLSRRPGRGTHVGDLTSGTGIAEAARGAEVIVHAASDTFRFGRGDVTQTEHLLEQARAARHLLYVSIVGIDQIPFAYYKRKLECERRIATSGIPYTLLRATQFHELIAEVLHRAGRLPIAPLPLDFRFQTVAADEVAERAAELAVGEPAGGRLNFGGPEVQTLAQMAAGWRSVLGRPRRLVRLPLPGTVARAFRAGLNTCPGEGAGRQTWTEYVSTRPAPVYSGLSGS
jgi:uncharacterized protein YbjT (DUF2867 family)